MDSAGTYSGLRWSGGSTWLVSRPSDSFFFCFEVNVVFILLLLPQFEGVLDGLWGAESLPLFLQGVCKKKKRPLMLVGI